MRGSAAAAVVALMVLAASACSSSSRRAGNVPSDTSTTPAVSNDGGQWRRVQFGNETVITEPDVPTPGRFVTTHNLCDPSCAAGHVERDAWKYSSADGRFERVDSAVCDPVSNGHLRCDKPNSPLASVSSLTESPPAVWVTPSTGVAPGRSFTVSLIDFPPG